MAMLKPTFRFFIIPLGAICTLASLSSQNAAPRAQHDTGSMLVRQQVIDLQQQEPLGGLRDLDRRGPLTQVSNHQVPPTTRMGCPPPGRSASGAASGVALDRAFAAKRHEHVTLCP